MEKKKKRKEGKEGEEGRRGFNKVRKTSIEYERIPADKYDSSSAFVLFWTIHRGYDYCNTSRPQYEARYFGKPVRENFSEGERKLNERLMVIHAPQPQYQARPDHPLLTYPPFPNIPNTHLPASKLQLAYSSRRGALPHKKIPNYLQVPTYLTTYTAKPDNNNQHHTNPSSLHKARNHLHIHHKKSPVSRPPSLHPSNSTCPSYSPHA
ncbi:uncharacterized protein RSE6_13176 [Rhynchosporium secalis]|uniref:Uncharacterized protein n=1 Tax=Rhynchosporium secalis TaxID=38038 RepID=A0A1E1MS77_RHYSE|nr:uncharacterized protein RSE6_13176 [Rhynchosporium secalis]